MSGGPKNLRQNQRWTPLGIAASLLGISQETLRLYVHGKDGRPVIPSRQGRRGFEVQPAEASRILTANRTPCTRLHQDDEPEPASTEKPIDPTDPDADMSAMLRSLVAQFKDTIHEQPTIDSDDLRAFASTVTALEKIEESRAKRAKSLSPDAAVELLNGLQLVHVQELDKTAPVLAQDLLKFVNDTFGVDLLQRNLQAPALLEERIRIMLNKTLDAERAFIADQVRGVPQLELSA